MPQTQSRIHCGRRDFIAWGTLAAGWSVLPGGRYAVGAPAPEQQRAGIFVFLDGGPSHVDTFDLKPQAAAEYRGPFEPISTNVPGFQVCEHLPRLAACADKYAVLRNVSHSFGEHNLGRIYLCTGTRPIASLKYPEYGAVVAKEHGGAGSIPPYIGIPSSPLGPGFLGPAYSAFGTGTLPGGANRPISVRGIQLPSGVTLDQLDRRQDLLRSLDRQFEAIEGEHKLVDALDDFNEHAYHILRSPETREALDLSRESPSFAARFGSDRFGQACLLAVRLVEAGVKFVSIRLGGWDTHSQNFTRLQGDLLPKLDVGIAGLLTGLDERGLLGSTAVLVCGEFGRTPKINDNTPPGRDHHPQCMSVLMAGGTIQGGQVMGESDTIGAEPAGDAHSPDDVAATFYANMGIDPTLQYTVSERPITLVRDGRVIREMLG